MPTDDLQQLALRVMEAEGAGEAKPWLDRLINALCQITGLELHPAIFLDRDATSTDHGKAVSPTTAAQCAEDIERSRVFMRGIVQAIADQADNCQPVNLLYAGTGPFALLLLPALACFQPSNLRVTLLDIHRDSLTRLAKVINHMGASNFVTSVECADATSWKPASDQMFDIIVSETMKHLLQQEPQVRIFSHLQQFMKPSGVLIPEAVRLSASLTNSRGLFSQSQTLLPLGEFLVLNRATAERLHGGDTTPLLSQLYIPDDIQGMSQLKLATEITVYKETQLRENQSQLTLPRYRDVRGILPGKLLRCQYQQGREPDWAFTYESLPETETSVVPSSELSPMGIAHLIRLWQKTQINKTAQRVVNDTEWPLDKLLLETLCPSLASGLAQLYQAESVEAFEVWLQSGNKIRLDKESIEQLNFQLLHQTLPCGCALADID